MYRPARPTLHWLLWLVIALLPLRGWAQAQMAVPAVVMSAAAEMPGAGISHDHPHTDDAVPACHGHADSKASASHGGSCSLCDVCHASLGLTTPVELRLPALPDTVPAATPITGLADGPPSEFFRPPRHPA